MRNSILILFSFFHLSVFTQSSIVLPIGGIYSKPIVVKKQVSSTVYYTRDGSKPTKSSLKFTDSLKLDTSVVLRFLIIDSTGSYYDNHSYILTNRKFTLPVISIAVDPTEMFDPVRGLYMKGLNAEPVMPYDGANYHSERELEINIEYFDTSAVNQFNQLAGLKIYGGYSRTQPQKSFGIISRSGYGDKNFDYPLFPDLPYNKYKSFVLRNSGSDNTKAHFRDVFMTQLVKDLSFDIQSYHPCVVFINGKYWGIYHIREKLNEHYIKQHYGADKDSVTIMKHRNSLRIGEDLNYEQVLAFIRKTNFKSNGNLDSLNKLIDVSNFLDYNISQTYFANTDAGGNIRYWRTQNDTSRWKWIMFDTDFGFGLDGSEAYKRNSIVDFTKASEEKWPYPSWATMFMRNLLENDSIKIEYINRFSHYLNTVFDSVRVNDLMDSIKNQLKHEMPYHYSRWNIPFRYWDNHLSRLRDFSNNRVDYLRKHLQSYFGLEEMVDFTLYNSEHAVVSINNTLVNDPFKGKYFKNVPVSIIIKPHVGYEFKGFKDTSIHLVNGSILLKDDSKLYPVIKRRQRSNYEKQVIFSEFNLKGGDNHGDWIELYNSSDNAICLKNWKLYKEGDSSLFVIKDSIVIQPKAFIVISSIDSLFSQHYPNTKSVKGLFTFKDTSTIILFDSLEQLVDSIKLNFDGKNHIELTDLTSKIYSTDKWDSNKKYTPGDLNSYQVYTKQFAFITKYILLPLILIIILSITFVVVKNKRLRSSTE